MARFQSSTGAFDAHASDITIYGWDYENRLVLETHYANYAAYRPARPTRSWLTLTITSEG